MKVLLSFHYRRSFYFACALHVLLLLALIFHFTFLKDTYAVQPSHSVIQAVAVNAAQLQAMIQPAPTTPVTPPPQPAPASSQLSAATVVPASPKPIKPPPPKAKVVNQKQIAAQISQELAQETAPLKNNQKSLQAVKLATQQLIQQQLANTASTSTADASEDSAEIDKYKALIIQAISNQWIVPQGAKKEEMAKLLVKLAPGGMVLSVEIIQSSGDDALDRSAKTAVLKASPLPVPQDSGLFTAFREINLTVQPEGISSAPD